MWKLLFGVSLALTLAGCRSGAKTALERGAGVYARACATCHGSLTVPGRTRGFKVKPPFLGEPSLQRRLSDDDLVRTITEGKGEMPPFGRMLSESELNQLVVYLRSLKGSGATAR
jgi:mono/diheme cytochrome c family protein